MLVYLSHWVVCEVENSGVSVGWRRYCRDVSVGVYEMQENCTVEVLISPLKLWQSSNVWDGNHQIKISVMMLPTCHAARSIYLRSQNINIV
jgi:hypothetical protein